MATDQLTPHCESHWPHIKETLHRAPGSTDFFCVIPDFTGIERLAAVSVALLRSKITGSNHKYSPVNKAPFFPAEMTKCLFRYETPKIELGSVCALKTVSMSGFGVGCGAMHVNQARGWHLMTL